MYFHHLLPLGSPLLQFFRHLAIFDVKLAGAFALVLSFVSAAVSDLGPALPSGVFAAAIGVSAWVIASAMIRPALCGSLRTPARSTSPSVVFISFATSVLSSGLGAALASAVGAALASGASSGLASAAGAALASGWGAALG